MQDERANDLQVCQGSKQQNGSFYVAFRHLSKRAALQGQ
jgi:hypothetical protein